MNSKKEYSVVLLCTLVFGVFVFLGARAHTLWADEAETGIFARNILHFGSPTGWDGVNLMGIRDGVTLNSDLVNARNPWPQYYVAAASTMLLGESALAVRFPFILISLLTIPLIFSIVNYFGGKHSGYIAMLLATLSVQYILFSYQARYFALVNFFGLVQLWSVLRITKKHWYWLFLAGISGTLFLYSNHGAFPFWFVSLCFATLYYHFKKQGKRALLPTIGIFLVLGAVAGVAFLPWLAFSSLSQSTVVVGVSVVSFIANFPIWFWLVYNQFNTANVFPIGLVMILGIVAFVQKVHRRAIGFFSVFIISYFVLLTAASMLTPGSDAIGSIRYHTSMIPMFLMWVSLGIDGLWRWHKKVGILILVIFLATNLLSFSSPRSFLYEYIREAMTRYPTTDDLVARYILAHSKPGETAFSSMDRSHEPLTYFLGTRIKFVNRITLGNGKFFPKNIKILPTYIYHFISEPDWLVIYGNSETKHPVDWRELPVGVKLGDYEEIVLPVYALDMSRPELTMHEFSPVAPTKEEMIYLYHKKQ